MPKGSGTSTNLGKGGEEISRPSALHETAPLGEFLPSFFSRLLFTLRSSGVEREPPKSVLKGQHHIVPRAATKTDGSSGGEPRREPVLDKAQEQSVMGGSVDRASVPKAPLSMESDSGHRPPRGTKTPVIIRRKGSLDTTSDNSRKSAKAAVVARVDLPSLRNASVSSGKKVSSADDSNATPPNPSVSKPKDVDDEYFPSGIPLLISRW